MSGNLRFRTRWVNFSRLVLGRRISDYGRVFRIELFLDF